MLNSKNDPPEAVTYYFAIKHDYLLQFSMIDIAHIQDMDMLSVSNYENCYSF